MYLQVFSLLYLPQDKINNTAKGCILTENFCNFLANDEILIIGKIKITLDKRRQLDDDTYPIKLYCNIPKKEVLRISTNIYVKMY